MVCPTGPRGIRIFFQWHAQRARGGSIFNGSPNAPGGVSFFNGLPNGPGGVRFSMVRPTGLRGRGRLFFNGPPNGPGRGFGPPNGPGRGFGFFFQWSAQRARGDSFLSTGSLNAREGFRIFFSMVRPTGPGGVSFFFSMVRPTGPGGFVFKYWFAQRVWGGFGFF